jgi:hypothetical protein
VAFALRPSLKALAATTFEGKMTRKEGIMEERKNDRSEEGRRKEERKENKT